MAIKFFNKLPLSLRNLEYKTFKQKLEVFLINEAFYSINEFIDKTWSASDFGFNSI